MAVNCLVTNIFLYVQQKKEIHTGLKQIEYEPKLCQNFPFRVNYHFKVLSVKNAM